MPAEHSSAPVKGVPSGASDTTRRSGLGNGSSAARLARRLGMRPEKNSDRIRRSTSDCPKRLRWRREETRNWEMLRWPTDSRSPRGSSNSGVSSL